MASTVTGATLPGSLIVAGTGIASVAHITLETDNHLKSAEKVFFLVYDPAIQAYIQSKHPNATDLVQYFKQGKNRYESNLEMSEVMLKDVRAGRKVFAMIYGHPGITASPAHMALAMARREGFEAKMLPGISLADCMFADLEIDPALSGWATCEATELLAHGRSLNTGVHNVVLNIGNVGEREDNALFSVLIDRLEKDYGPDHRVLHYLAENLPQSSTAMVAYSIDEFHVEAMARWIRPTSALYIPPLQAQEPTAIDLKLPDIVLRYLRNSVQLEDTMQGTRPVTQINVDQYVKEARARLPEHVPPQNYKSLRASPAMREFMIALSLDQDLKARYKSGVESRDALIGEYAGLTDREKLALRMGQAGPVAAVMLRATDAEPSEQELGRIEAQNAGDYSHPILAT